ncbi:MAG: hypothetical protein H0X58_04715, partial [Acidimicrobiia bacterium]|nr:hypothetical protein [Acidimicrobiia bacterium]
MALTGTLTHDVPPVAAALLPSSVPPWLARLQFWLGLVLAAPVAGRGEEIDDLVMARARRGDHQAFGEIVGCY